MQQAIWDDCIAPADNEWTPWTDAIALAEAAAEALTKAGWKVVPLDADLREQGFSKDDYDAATEVVTEGMRRAGMRAKEAGSSDYRQLLTPQEFANHCTVVARSIAAARQSGRTEPS